MNLAPKGYQSRARFSADEIAATERLCGDFLKRNSIDLDAIDFDGADWSALCGASREAGRELSRIIELRHGDKPDPAAALALEVMQEVRQDIEAAKTMQRGGGQAHMRPIPPDGEVRADGGYHGGDYEGEEASVSLKPEERFSDWAARSGGSRGGSELRGLTTGGLLKAMVLGPKTEAERRALAEGTDSAGGYSVPDVLSSAMIDRMRRQSVVIRAGARTIPLTSDVNNIAKVLTDPVPAWRAENEEITNSDATFGRVQLLPKSLAVLCRVSRELLEDSLNIDRVLPDIIAKAMGAEVDRMCLFGTGADDQPTGLTLMSGINEVALDGALSSHSNGFYGSLIEARRLLLDANSAEPTAYIMNPREDETLIAALTGDGYPMPAPPKIAAIRQLVTTAVPKNGGVGTNESSIVFGDFSRMLLGVRNSLRIEVLKERYADYHQYAFIAHLRATVAVEHVLAFGHISGITPEA